MAEESFQEKTEKATPKRRTKARDEGQVAKSQELPSVFILLAAVLMLLFISNMFRDRITVLMQDSFTFTSIPAIDVQFCVILLRKTLNRYFGLVVPILITVFITAVSLNIAQVGFHLSLKAIAPKLERFNVFKGLKRLFSLKSFVELVKSIIKLVIVGTVAYFVIKGESGRFPHLYHLDLYAILVFILKTVFKLFIGVLLVMIVIAVLDYIYQKWQFEEKLKMTKQEVKEESKQTEGDPQVKSRIRSVQYQAARKRMMHQVPEADVVVTNPTHLALAIRYDPVSMAAPQVVAKGAGLVADRIKEVATVHGIPVIENKELAQNLYRIVKIGEEVPMELYQAVAELLAYVYKLKGKTA